MMYFPGPCSRNMLLHFLENREIPHSSTLQCGQSHLVFRRSTWLRTPAWIRGCYLLLGHGRTFLRSSNRQVCGMTTRDGVQPPLYLSLCSGGAGAPPECHFSTVTPPQNNRTLGLPGFACRGQGPNAAMAIEREESMRPRLVAALAPRTQLFARRGLTTGLESSPWLAHAARRDGPQACLKALVSSQTPGPGGILT